MAANEKPHKISIGFLGGQTLAARVEPAELTKLRNALGSDGWHDLTAEAGTVAGEMAQGGHADVDHAEHWGRVGTRSTCSDREQQRSPRGRPRGAAPRPRPVASPRPWK